DQLHHADRPHRHRQSVLRLHRYEEVAGHVTGLGDLRAALEGGGRRDRPIDKRLPALISGSSIHEPASLPKRQALPSAATPKTSKQCPSSVTCCIAQTVGSQGLSPTPPGAGATDPGESFRQELHRTTSVR